MRTVFSSILVIPEAVVYRIGICRKCFRERSFKLFSVDGVSLRIVQCPLHCWVHCLQCAGFQLFQLATIMLHRSAEHNVIDCLGYQLPNAYRCSRWNYQKLSQWLSGIASCIRPCVQCGFNCQWLSRDCKLDLIGEDRDTSHHWMQCSLSSWN